MFSNDSFVNIYDWHRKNAFFTFSLSFNSIVAKADSKQKLAKVQQTNKKKPNEQTNAKKEFGQKKLMAFCQETLTILLLFMPLSKNHQNPVNTLKSSKTLQFTSIRLW